MDERSSAPLSAPDVHAQASVVGGRNSPAKEGGMYRCNMSAAGLAGGRLGTLNEAPGSRPAGVMPSSACSWLSSPPDASKCAERSS